MKDKSNQTLELALDYIEWFLRNESILEDGSLDPTDIIITLANLEILKFDIQDELGSR